MCRRHSHLTAKRVQITTLNLEDMIQIEMDQPLGVDMPGGAKLILKSPICLYVPCWGVAGWSVSQQGPAGKSVLSVYDVPVGSGRNLITILETLPRHLSTG